MPVFDPHARAAQLVQYLYLDACDHTRIPPPGFYGDTKNIGCTGLHARFCQPKRFGIGHVEELLLYSGAESRPGVPCNFYKLECPV